MSGRDARFCWQLHPEGHSDTHSSVHTLPLALSTQYPERHSRLLVHGNPNPPSTDSGWRSSNSKVESPVAATSSGAAASGEISGKLLTSNAWNSTPSAQSVSTAGAGDPPQDAARSAVNNIDLVAIVPLLLHQGYTNNDEVVQQ